MSDENLRRLLKQLHEELERTRSVDERDDELLRHLNADIRDLLERSEQGQDLSDESMLERLQDAVDHFEDRYPTLAMTLSEMMRILSNAGI